MKNNFFSHVIKMRFIVVLRLLGILLGVSAITVPIVIYMGKFAVTFLMVMNVIVIFIGKKVSNKISKKENVYEPIDRNNYVFIVFSKTYLDELTNILNANMKLPDNIKNVVNYMQYMIDNNQMTFIKKKFKLNNLVNLVNEHLKSKNIQFGININDILKNDDEVIKIRRKKHMNTDLHDLWCVRSILLQNELDLIIFCPEDSGNLFPYVFTILPIEKVKKLNTDNV